MAERGFALTLAGATASTIGNIISLSGGGQTRDTIDVSDMDSTSNFRELLSGVADGGEISIELTYDGTAAGTANYLNTSYQSGTAEEWTITYTGTSSTWVCTGFITSLGIPGGDYEGKVTQSLTIKFTGVPVYTDKA